MWHSATAAILLAQQHLLVGGLGGVIAVIVGGVVSIITLRGRRAAPTPAANPQPAPEKPKSTPRPGFGEPAPPTSPARRLYRGPITLSAPGDPSREAPAASQTTPEDARTPHPEPSDSESFESYAPILRPTHSLAAQWRAEAEPLPPAELTHAPVWNHAPFTRPGAIGAQTEASPVSEPPIWRSTGASALFAPAPIAQPDTHSPHDAPAPIWEARLAGIVPQPADADETLPYEALGAEAEVESEPPIWPSYLRPE